MLLVNDTTRTNEVSKEMALEDGGLSVWEVIPRKEVSRGGAVERSLLCDKRPIKYIFKHPSSIGSSSFGLQGIETGFFASLSSRLCFGSP